MVRRWLVLLGVVAVVGTLSSCAGDGGPPSSPIGDDRPARQRSNVSRVAESTQVACAVGERPGYFVAGPADAPVALLLGCARLGVSGKRVEFSGNIAHIDGGRHACVNPAYSGRGQRGLYIPAICKLEPSLSRFAVRDAAQPRQGVRDYAYVIWGTAGASTDVVANFAGGTAEAAGFRVGADLAREFGESSFSLFVVELPLSAACVPVTVSGGASAATERIPPQTKLCEHAPRSGAGGSASSRASTPGGHRPRSQHRPHDRDLDPRLRHGRDAHRLQRPPLLRLTSIETARGNPTPPDYRRSTSHVTRPRPQLLHLTRRLRHR
jgi:hypothetical protein